jgi:transcription elongation factor Elf1
MGEEKITEVPAVDGTPVFTCKRCGSHNFAKVGITQSQYGGSGAGTSYLITCTNCHNAEKLEE